MTPLLYLFDDEVADSFHPFSLSRPTGELLFGAFTLRERAERFWKVRCAGHFSRPWLLPFGEPDVPPVVRLHHPHTDGVTILQCSRAVLEGRPPTLDGGPFTLYVGDSVVGWVLPGGASMPDEDFLAHPKPLPGSRRLDLTGRTLGAPWDLMNLNGEQLRTDIPRFFPGYAAEALPGCHILGDGLLSLASGVTVEPECVFDLSEGPIRLGQGVKVRAHTRLGGPAFVGTGSVLLGGVFSETTIGPVSRVRGEIECSVILGYSNKAHDGFLGHAYLGKWVNLGAFTTNSDLKNNYGEVRVVGPDGPNPTGLMKVGCFLGDHVKTGIGTLLNTGTVVGAGSNIFGGAMPPTYVPPFSWGTGRDLAEFRLDRFLEVAEKAMVRRGVVLESGMREVLRSAWERTRAERALPG